MKGQQKLQNLRSSGAKTKLHTLNGPGKCVICGCCLASGRSSPVCSAHEFELGEIWALDMGVWEWSKQIRRIEKEVEK